MLDPREIDLASLCEALQDQSWDHEWWLDPATGEVEPWPTDADALLEIDEEHPFDRDWLRVEPIRSREWYCDMEDFAGLVRDRRARDLLDRALAGRGAFRRFKDTLFEFPELRESWLVFQRVRAERRALDWLAEENLVDPARAKRAIAERPDPPLAAPEVLDAEAVARATATDLHELYGDRLRRVLLFGSWARGDAHPESDVDLLVVLDSVVSPWQELRRMDDVLDRQSLEHGTVVSAIVVAEEEIEHPTRPALIRATSEGLAVT